MRDLRGVRRGRRNRSLLRIDLVGDGGSISSPSGQRGRRYEMRVGRE